MFKPDNSSRSAVGGLFPNQNRRIPLYRDFVVLQLGALVFLIDQFTKFMVRETLPLGSSVPYSGFFRITHTFNTGSAFGIFQGQNTPLIFISIVGIIILAMIYRSQAQPNNLLRFSIGLQLGGAFGNLIDRIFRDRVTDFIDVGPWPVFNLADSSIVIGLIILAWIFLKPGRQAPSRAVTGMSGAGQIDGLGGGYAWCPICDGDMAKIPTGWRCTTCGVRERVEPAFDFPFQTSTSSLDGALNRDAAPVLLLAAAADYGDGDSREPMPDVPTVALDAERIIAAEEVSASPDEALET